MNAEERQQIQSAIRKGPKTVWAYWPFLFPVIVVVIGVLVQVALLIYFSMKIPDLEILFKHGKLVQPVWDSELIKQAVLTSSASITVTILLFTVLARQAFKYLSLLRTAAKDLGINEN